MPRTASPAVSVIVPLIARAAWLERAGLQLRSQTLSDIEIILVGGAPGAELIASLRADERVRREGIGLSVCDALNAGLEACRGERVLIFDPRDELDPRALEALAVRMRHGDHAGAFGGFRFCAPIGELPLDPLADAPHEIGLDELLHCQWFPLSAMMVDAGAIGAIRFRSHRTHEDSIHPADYEWLLRLSEVGVRWSRSNMRVAQVRVRPLECVSAIEQSLAERARLIHLHATTRGFGAPEIRALTQDAVDARTGILSDFEEPPAFYSAQRSSSAEMARWWHRLGCVGPAPDHLRPEICAESNPSAAPSLPERTLALAEQLDPSRPVVLMGTGPAITHFAGVLSGLGAVLRISADAAQFLSVDSAARPIAISGPEQAPRHAQFVLPSREQALQLLPGRECFIIEDATRSPFERLSLLPDGSCPPPHLARGLLALPALIAEHIASTIDSTKPALLIGLGRNARRLARALAKRKIPFSGFDHALREAPAWSKFDGIDFELLADLPTTHPQIILPVVHDSALLDQLARIFPGTTCIARWSLASEVLCGMRASIWTTLAEYQPNQSLSTPSERAAA